MRIIRDVAEMQALGQSLRGHEVGFVPTMGYLHRGHTSLMELTRPLCEHLVVSIYVNPLQFAPTDDLARYPRDLIGDATKCEAAGVDFLFIPEGFYPATFRTQVIVSGVTSRWEGAERPGHFAGVSTVVSRLFGVVLDEFGGVAGLVTMEDILAQLVGKIRTNAQPEGFVMEKISPGRWRVNGSMRLDDFRREYPALGGAAEVETMGGLLTHMLGVVPEAGGTATFHDLRFTAQIVDERRVRELLVQRLK